MPVGCLGVSSRSGAADSSLYLNQADNAAEKKVETMVENIEIMQQRLLIQLMRLGPRGDRAQLPCDTCEVCCQADSGWSLMADLVRVNSEAVWCPGLVRAVNSLRYQVSIIFPPHLMHSFHHRLVAGLGLPRLPRHLRQLGQSRGGGDGLGGALSPAP